MSSTRNDCTPSRDNGRNDERYFQVRLNIRAIATASEPREVCLPPLHSSVCPNSFQSPLKVEIYATGDSGGTRKAGTQERIKSPRSFFAASNSVLSALFMPKRTSDWASFTCQQPNRFGVETGAPQKQLIRNHAVVLSGEACKGLVLHGLITLLESRGTRRHTF